MKPTPTLRCIPWLVFLIAWFACGIPVLAQDDAATDPLPDVNAAGSPIMPGSIPSETWVTTQDYVALRQGPSRAFTQLATVPAALTLPAYGRTSDTSWI